MFKHAIQRAAAMACGVSLLSAAVALGQAQEDLSSLKENQAVFVREGDSWSKATFVKKEGRRYQIRYDDGTEEWVTADRLKTGPAGPAGDAKPAGESPAGASPETVDKEPANPKAPVFAIGGRAELKWGGSWHEVKIVNRRGDWYLVEYTKWKDWREWAEPWRLRAVGSDYDIDSHHTNPRVSGTQGPPTPAPGPAPTERKPGERRGRPRAGATEPAGHRDQSAVDEPPPVKITDAVRDGKELLAMASGPWTAPAAAMDARSRIPTNVTPTILPSLDGAGAKWKSLRISGTRAILIAERSFGGAKTTGLVRVDILNNGVARAEMPTYAEPLDLSPNGSLILARGTPQQGRVDLYKMTTAAPQHVISFVPSSGEKAAVQDAFFVDEQTIVTLGDNEIAAWDFAKAQSLWHLSATGGKVGRSANNKALAVHTKEGIAIVELPSGKVLNVLPCETPGDLAFSGDGKRLLMLAQSDLTVWDMDSGAQLYTMTLPKGISGNIVAINKDAAMIGDYLFAIDKKMPVWRYDAATLEAWGGGRVFSIYNDGKRNVLTSAEIPHAKAKEAIAKAAEAAMIIKPGMSVTLDIQPEGDDATKAQVVAGLTRRLAAAGVKIEDNQPLRLVARTEVGQTEQRQYERRGFGVPPGRGQPETVTITRKAARLMLQYEGQTVWQTEQWSGNDPGMIVHLRDNQTVQDQVNSNANNPTAVAWMAHAKVPTMMAAPVELKLLPSSSWALGGVKDNR